MPHLGSVVAKVRQRVRRFAPVGHFWSGPRPDHAPYFKVDQVGAPILCCEWHEEHAFRPHTDREWTHVWRVRL